MDKIRDNIKNKLTLLNIDINKIPKKQLEYLIKIETLLIEQTRRQEFALSELKELGFSINSVSDSTGISRQTFYNNPILKQYVEYSINLFNENNVYFKIKELKESLADVLDENTKMKYRDLNFELLKHDLEDIQILLKQKDKEISQLRKKNIDLNKKINSLKNEIVSLKNSKKESTGEVIDYPF